jgi:hypothetical protein
MDFSAAAQWVDEAMTVTHQPTEKLLALRERDPELAETIERLCNTIRAASGFVMASGAASVLDRCNRDIEPWIVVPNADPPAMEGIAQLFARAKAAVQKPKASRPFQKPKMGRPVKDIGGSVRCLKADGRWQAEIRIKGKRFYLGKYETESDARAAFDAARAQAS